MPWGGEKRSQNEAAPCPGVSAGGEGRGTLKPCDRCPDHGLVFPHGIDPLAFREEQPLGLCCGCDQPFGPLHLFTLVLPSLADRVAYPGLIEVIHKVRRLLYLLHVGYFKPEVFTHKADCKLGAAQLSLFESEAVDVIHIYRSQQQQLGEVVEQVREWRRAFQLLEYQI